LATMMINAVPKISLQGYSPYFFMFGSEPQCFNSKENVLDDFFDISEQVKRNTNNRMFAKLLFEYLIQQRQRQNTSVTHKYRSFPKDSLVYVKDHSVQPHKKIKHKYIRAPQKVVKEYKNVIYAVDLLGR